MEKIIVVGSGGHAKVVIDIIEKTGKYKILGLIDSYRFPKETVCGYEILGNESVLLQLKGEIYGGVVAIGDNWIRNKVVDKIKSIVPWFKFVSLVHPSAVLGNSVMIGDGTIVMAGSVINSNVIIGEHSIINTKSSVDHDCFIGDYCTIAPGVTLGGNIKMGSYSVVSLGANIIHSIHIGEHTIIGAGSTVVRNIGSYAVAYGTPAKRIRTRTVGEKYL
ncbi:acetyltransferase [Paenibacillus elgii]